MLLHDTGILHAPTAFGKTVVAAAMIAKRKVSTLILVHRAELLRQWQERLNEFLELSGKTVGIIGGGKRKAKGIVDVALLQTVARGSDIDGLLQNYGQVIVDECHHISAFSFESVLRQAKSKYVMGLTATPIRRDGHQPIIFMQCGGVRHRALMPKGNVSSFDVFPQFMPAPSTYEGTTIQDIFSSIISNASRNSRIVDDVLSAYADGRKILLLTERAEHLLLLSSLLSDKIDHCFILHGRLPKKQRASTLERLTDLGPNASRVLLATGKLIGEGFDHSPLDTMFLTMPISWRGTLQQYAGRLHREHVGKNAVRIYDYVDTDNAMLQRMWEKRLRGYASLGYTVHGLEYCARNNRA